MSTDRTMCVSISRDPDCTKANDKDLQDIIASLLVTLKGLYKAQDGEVIVETRHQSPFDIVPAPYFVQIEVSPGHPSVPFTAVDQAHDRIAEELDRTLPEHMQGAGLVCVRLKLVESATTAA